VGVGGGGSKPAIAAKTSDGERCLQTGDNRRNGSTGTPAPSMRRHRIGDRAAGRKRPSMFGRSKRQAKDLADRTVVQDWLTTLNDVIEERSSTIAARTLAHESVRTAATA